MPGIVTNELERGYVPAPYAHQPPGRGSLDGYCQATGALSPGAFHVELRERPCPGCGRHPVPQAVYCLPAPTAGAPTPFHATAYRCPACLATAALEGCVAIPPNILEANLPAGERLFPPGSVWAARSLLSHPLIGQHRLYPLLVRHLAGDWGEVGNANAARVHRRDREAGPLAGVLKQGIIAIQSGKGVVRSSYCFDKGSGGRGLNYYVHGLTALAGPQTVTVLSDRRYE